jgi:hypothetical protein
VASTNGAAHAHRPERSSNGTRNAPRQLAHVPPAAASASRQAWVDGPTEHAVAIAASALLLQTFWNAVLTGVAVPDGHDGYGAGHIDC